MIEALTFDFWDTIAIDDSDELKRAQMGLPSKADARIALFVEHITRYHPEVSSEQAIKAYRGANARFRHDWHNNHHTPSVYLRLNYAYDCLGLAPAPGKYAALVREVNELARAIETMEVRIPPDFAPHAHAMLAELAQHYTLAIISDTIHTTGRGIRHLLYQQDLLQYFKHFLFSDEVGESKPSPRIFRRASLEIGLPPTMIAHVGDRESNDVVGPLSIGMRAILFTGIVDRGSEQSRATAICTDFRRLPYLVQRMR